MRTSTLAALAASALCLSTARADPCGMVPPIWTGDGPAITRVGEQLTYVFYKEGVESFVIRPSFSGKVEEFGMLIPFPTPPALRKVDDAIFSHLAAAVEPPPVVIDLERRFLRMRRRDAGGGGGLDIRKRKGVRVLREEAVGMYEVAVLEAGSAQALQRWMDAHGYRYPEGMDGPCEDYVKLGWCFVAVKTRVGPQRGVAPRPGMREPQPALPAGASFDGNVQAMGFRFHSDELVVPMRLSAFNAGELNNTVYLLSDRPLRIDRIPTELVRTQLRGEQVLRHLRQPLPIEIKGGTLEDVERSYGKGYIAGLDRDPRKKNGLAGDLFAGDLLAVRLDRLALPHEEEEKVLLRIGERLSLRGEEIDALHREALAAERQAAVTRALGDLNAMTLTVIQGEFPREVLAEDNLRFSEHVAQGDPARFAAPVSTRGRPFPELPAADEGQDEPAPAASPAPQPETPGPR